MNITIHNHNFSLHSSGCIFWIEKKVLLIADVHLGKITHFRKHGSAVPHTLIQKNFEVLDNVISFFNPKKICFLGDLFHSSLNNEWLLFEQWRKKYYFIDILLIIGNHDIISPIKYKELNINPASEWVFENLLFTHHPVNRENYFNFCGHIHPGIELKGIGKHKIKLSCFHKRPYQFILPAFGVFTGKYIISPNREDSVYVISDNEVLLIDPRLL